MGAPMWRPVVGRGAGVPVAIVAGDVSPDRRFRPLTEACKMMEYPGTLVACYIRQRGLGTQSRSLKPTPTSFPGPSWTP